MNKIIECQKLNAVVVVSSGTLSLLGSRTPSALAVERDGFRLSKVSGGNVTLGMVYFRRTWSHPFWTTADQLLQEKESAEIATASTRRT